MTFRPLSVAAMAIGLSITCGAVAEPRDTRKPAVEKAPAAKDSTPKDAKHALRQLVTKHAEASGLARELQGYSLSPQLVQLRRYAEPGQQIKVVCIVSIALKDSNDVLVAEVRGTAAALDGSSLSALDAASYAAVMRVPSALAKLRGPRNSEIARR